MKGTGISDGIERVWWTNCAAGDAKATGKLSMDWKKEGTEAVVAILRSESIWDG